MTNAEFQPAIRETKERMVFAVPSDTNPKLPPYRVDLLANGGAGQCSCRDWNTRRGPMVRAGADGFTAESSCKHLRRVRLYFLQPLLEAMARSESE